MRTNFLALLHDLLSPQAFAALGNSHAATDDGVQTAVQLSAHTQSAVRRQLVLRLTTRRPAGIYTYENPRTRHHVFRSDPTPSDVPRNISTCSDMIRRVPIRFDTSQTRRHVSTSSDMVRRVPTRSETRRRVPTCYQMLQRVTTQPNFNRLRNQ